MKQSYPPIQIIHCSDHSFQSAGVERIIRHILPPNFFMGEAILQKLEERLPLICWTPLHEPPFEMTFFLFCQSRVHAFRFFYDMITRWLVPGKRLYAPLQFASDFLLPTLSNHPYSAGQLVIRVETEADIEILQKHLPIIEKEIRLGLTSSYQASRILEIKGLSTDAKTALIQENLVGLIKRRAHQFDYDILSEMQHFLVLCQEEFKQKRNYRHMGRIIAVNYLFRKTLALTDESYVSKRFVAIKLLRQKIEGVRPVLGVIVAINFLHENERLEGRHLARAIRKLIKNVNLVEGSFLSSKYRTDKGSILYVEVEKKDKRNFMPDEIQLLQNGLEDEIKAHIEESANPIFMPENEEVVLRNILILSEEVTFVRDLPQVILTYKEQTGSKLEFLVVLVRVVKSTTIPITRFFELVQSNLEFFFDRQKKVGYVRKKYPKEANVFRIQVEKGAYLRQDGSIDLYKAREMVAEELRHILGEFRDYNGGYMSKERELFLALLEQLGTMAQKHAFLLENYFYSIHPVARRASISLDALKALFLTLEKATHQHFNKKDKYSFQAEEHKGFCTILLVGVNLSFKRTFLESMNSVKIDREKWSYFFLKEGDHSYFGLFLEKASSEEFIEVTLVLEKSVEEWESRQKITTH